MQRDEQVQLPLPLMASTIHLAISLFEHQFHCRQTSLYLSGHILLSTGEQCLLSTWLPVARPEPELDLLGIGDPAVGDDDEDLTWVVATQASTLLLSTHQLDVFPPSRS